MEAHQAFHKKLHAPGHGAGGWHLGNRLGEPLEVARAVAAWRELHHGLIFAVRGQNLVVVLNGAQVMRGVVEKLCADLVDPAK